MEIWIMLSCLRVYLEGSAVWRIGESPVVCVDKQKAGDGSVLPGVFALALTSGRQATGRY